MLFWSIKGVYFLQTTNNLNFKLCLGCTHDPQSKYLLFYRRILDNGSCWMSLKSTSLALKKSCTSCPNWLEGEGRGCVEVIPTNDQFSLRKPSLRRFVMWESKNDFSSIPPSLTAGVDEKAGYAISRIESLTFACLFTELNSLKNWAHWTLFVIFILLLKTTWVWNLWNTYIFVEANEYF